MGNNNIIICDLYPFRLGFITTGLQVGVSVLGYSRPKPLAGTHIDSTTHKK